MAYFRIVFKEDNKLWQKYFTFAYRFVIGDNEEVKFPENYTLQSSDVLKIQALNHQGEVVKDISFFKVNETLKEALLQLAELSKFLDFAKL